jgi:cobalt-zinc-cadmium resistance protein CzcA
VASAVRASVATLPDVVVAVRATPGAFVGAPETHRVKVFGPARESRAVAESLREVLAAVGGSGARVRPALSPRLSLRPDPAALARYGVRAEEVDELFTLVSSGVTIGQLEDRGERTPVVMRVLRAPGRGVPTAEDMHVLTLRGKDSDRIPLSQIAALVEENEPVAVFREGSSPYVAVDVEATADAWPAVRDEARRKAATVAVPAGTRVVWDP